MSEQIESGNYMVNKLVKEGYIVGVIWGNLGKSCSFLMKRAILQNVFRKDLI